MSYKDVNETEYSERDVDEQSRGQRLKDSDYSRLLAGLLQLLEPEFIADREWDETERNVRNDRETLDIFHRREADAVKTEHSAEISEAVGSDQNSRDEVSGDCRKPERLYGTGHQKSREKCDCYAKKYIHWR